MYEHRERSNQMSKVGEVVTSRKFWAAMVALLLVFFGERAGVTGDTLTNAVAVLVSYILGQGLADIRAK